MKGRENRGPPSADLLVCFPSRAHLSLMPKPICSPARPPEPTKRHHNQHQRKLSNRGGGGGGHASPLLWSKPKPMGAEIAEPTSPKVTCAGQIRVRPNSKPNSCKSWQSVMEELEKIHNNKNKKKPNWIESLGFKKETMQFLACLRRIRFDFRCFGSFPASDLTSDDEDDDDEYEDGREKQTGIDESEGNGNSRTVFSKWFMVLQEEQNNRHIRRESRERVEDPVVGPPPNALLLMRCRSAPAKSWLEEREDEEREKEEEEKKSKSLAVLMSCDTDFYKLSSDIAKETWVVGGLKDQLSKSRSWKR